MRFYYTSALRKFSAKCTEKIPPDPNLLNMGNKEFQLDRPLDLETPLTLHTRFTTPDSVPPY